MWIYNITAESASLKRQKLFVFTFYEATDVTSNHLNIIHANFTVFNLI